MMPISGSIPEDHGKKDYPHLKKVHGFFTYKRKNSSACTSALWRMAHFATAIPTYPVLGLVGLPGSVLRGKKIRTLLHKHRHPEMALNMKLYNGVQKFAQNKKFVTVEEFVGSSRAITIEDRFAVNYYNLKSKSPGKHDSALRKQALSLTYDQTSLVGVHVEKRFKELKEDKANKAKIETATTIEKQIFLAELQEQAVKEVYDNVLPQRIAEGYFNPAVVFEEMKRLLEVDDSIPFEPKTVDDVKKIIRRELESFVKDKKIEDHQREYIEEFTLPLVEQYQHLFKDKTLEETLIFIRNLARVSAYQEHWDKSAFTGSDHGAKHIHNNIDGVKNLHSRMEQGDVREKDEFIEHITHIYHDIGYTVGLATTNFSCSKDHPLVGAKILEANREYFEKYLDKDSFETMHHSVLNHAIAHPDLTPTDMSLSPEKLDRRMVRSVTSVTDACATTYERKAQEFWEQPKAIIALAKLKFFLVQFPQYTNSLSKDGIAFDEWFNLDKNDPMDKLAHDFFQGIKKELRDLVDSSVTMGSKKKKLFKQAIEQQFNAFTADVTLGQYGGLFLGSEVERATKGPTKYVPVFEMAPSVLHEVLRELFGDAQAERAFSAICKEFHGDIKPVRDALKRQASSTSLGHIAHTPSEIVPTGNAILKISSVSDPRRLNSHITGIQKSVNEVSQRLIEVNQGRLRISFEVRKQILDEFGKVCQGLQTLDQYNDKLDTLLKGKKYMLPLQLLKNLISRSVFAKALEALQDKHVVDLDKNKDYHKLCNQISFVLLSQEDRAFLPEDLSDAVGIVSLKGKKVVLQTASYAEYAQKMWTIFSGYFEY